MNNFNLSKYIKNELDTNSSKESKQRSNKCLEEIGKSLGEYTNFHKILGEMSDNAINELHDAIVEVKFHRKRFTDFVTCTREEANKPENENRSIGYFTYGEFGGEYGYFKHRRKLDDIEQVWLTEHTECCYYNGQPCERWQDENGYAEEDCECELGKEYSSLILYELDEDLEKEMGVWKQDIVWYLDTNFNDKKIKCYFCRDRYYSLTHIKKDALTSCDNEKICEKIFNYDGKQDFLEGNIRIYSIRDVDEFEN